MKLNRNLVYAFSILPLLSFACNALSAPGNSPTQNPESITQENQLLTETPSESSVIQPTINWNTFLGIDMDSVQVADIATDSDGNTYILGSSHNKTGDSSNLENLSLTKIKSNGEKDWQISIVQTILTSYDSVAIDASGSIYISGSSNASWGNPINAFVPDNRKGADAFVAKVSPEGKILWNTFIGSNSSFFTLDKDGNINILKFYIYSDNSHPDVYFLKLSSDGVVLKESTKLNISTPAMKPRELRIDQNGNLYVSGETNSDFFVAKYTNDGSEIWQKNLGCETCIGYIQRQFEIDEMGNVYFLGISENIWGNPLIQNNSENENNTENEGEVLYYFVAKISNTGEFLWHTFISGTDIFDISLNKSGNIYITGFTEGRLVNSINEPNLNGDGFIAQLNSDGEIIWSLFIGGEGRDIARTIVFSDQHTLIVGGESKASFGNPVSEIKVSDENKGDIFTLTVLLP